MHRLQHSHARESYCGVGDFQSLRKVVELIIIRVNIAEKLQEVELLFLGL